MSKEWVLRHKSSAWQVQQLPPGDGAAPKLTDGKTLGRF